MKKAMKYYTILMRQTSYSNDFSWSRSWSKKIYTSKDMAIESLINYRKTSGMWWEFKIVELMITNEFS